MLDKKHQSLDEAGDWMVAEKARPRKRRRVLRVLFMLCAAVSGVAAWGFANMGPILISMAEARARQLAVEVMNEAIAEVMGTSATYTDLMNVTTDAHGRVTMLEANAITMNHIASQAALAAQNKLDRVAGQGVSIPLGSALGIGLFSGAGPEIRVSVVPVGSVSTRFVTSFETAGINQTRHEISLEASVLMKIVIPTGTDSVSVNTYVPIAESIIVGEVPQSYVHVPEDEMLNLIPD